MKVTVDLSKTKLAPTPNLFKKIAAAHELIHKHDGTIENAWVNLPKSISKQEIQNLNETAQWIQKNTDALIVIGIGGSYLGAFAGLQLLQTSFPVEFVGTSFDPNHIAEILNKYNKKCIAVNVISKSGTTLEIVAAFNIIEQFLKAKYKKNWNKYLFFTTDSEKGYLRPLAKKENIKSFVIPNGVGGRYSVLSPVGLLPFAVAGLSIDEIMKGAKTASDELTVLNEKSNKIADLNPAYQYALARYLIHNKTGKQIEVVAGFQENIQGLLAWHQQLFGESEGKNGKGLFVSPMIFTRDLHSMGQFIQQGNPILFETFINIENPALDLKFAQTNEPATQTPVPSMNQINHAAFHGTLAAHTETGIPVIVLNVEKLDAANLGYLFYFFEISCAMSAYLLEVNPFDQPGVESYKKHMRSLL